jgi:predicted secreted protein
MPSWRGLTRRETRPGADPAARIPGGRRSVPPLTIAVLLAVLAGLVACGGSAPTPAPTPPPPAEANVTVGPLEEGTLRMGTTVAAGGIVTIVAPENPSTGYTWTLTLPAGVTEVSDDYAGPTAAASPIVGAGGTRTWVVRIDQVGEYALRGTYARPWESRRPPSRFVVTVFASPPDQPTPTMVFTEKQSPGLWATDTGMVAAVCLRENGSTGYEWTMTLGPGLRLLAEQAVTPGASPAPGGQRIWLILVEEPGKTTVKGEYARPGESGGGSAATFSLAITAKTPGGE